MRLYSNLITSSKNFIQIAYYNSYSDVLTGRIFPQCRSFNYILNGENAKRITLSDITISEEKKQELIACGIMKIADYPLAYQESSYKTDAFLQNLKNKNFQKHIIESTSFILSENSIFLMLPVGKNGWFFVSELDYKKTEGLLKMDFIKTLKLEKVEFETLLRLIYGDKISKLEIDKAE